MMAKVKMPTGEEIDELRGSFLEAAKAVVEKEKRGKGSPKRDFLSSLSSEIKVLLDEGMSYTGLKGVIKSTYGIDVSTQIISNFARRELGVSRRKKFSGEVVDLEGDKSVSENQGVPVKKLEGSDGIKHIKEGF